MMQLVTQISFLVKTRHINVTDVCRTKWIVDEASHVLRNCDLFARPSRQTLT